MLKAETGVSTLDAIQKQQNTIFQSMSLTQAVWQHALYRSARWVERCSFLDG